MVRVFQYIQQSAMLYGGYDALERNTAVFNELLVFLYAPFKGNVHPDIVALCVHFADIQSCIAPRKMVNCG